MITRMQDINRPECQKRPIKFLTGFIPRASTGNGAKMNGAEVQCPFCDFTMIVLRNHLGLSGKRCNCGALAFKNFFYFIEGEVKTKSQYPWAKMVRELTEQFSSVRGLAHEIELSFGIFVEHTHLTYIMGKDWTEFSEPRWSLGNALIKLYEHHQKGMEKCRLRPGSADTRGRDSNPIYAGMTFKECQRKFEDFNARPKSNVEIEPIPSNISIMPWDREQNFAGFPQRKKEK